MTNTRTLTNVFLTLAGSLVAVTALAQSEQPPVNQDSYLVKPGDELNVSVWGEEELTLDVLIRPDGGFSFPLAGDLVAAEKSVEQIRTELTERLTRYIPDLVATVMVTAINGNKIYVVGQVNRPGDFIMNPRLDVLQALSLAGGTTPFAQVNDIRILRRTSRGQTALPFSFGDVSKGRSLEQNIVLESGDVVVVP